MESASITGVLSRLWRRWRSLSERRARQPARPENNPRARLGARGEKIARRWLARSGYKILYRNYRPPGGGEVDVVCRDRATGELVFVEVKTRMRAGAARPSDAVDARKQHLLLRGAMAWLRALDNPEVRGRFDVVEVITGPGGRPAVSVIRDAFPPPGSWLY